MPPKPISPEKVEALRKCCNRAIYALNTAINDLVPAREDIVADAAGNIVLNPDAGEPETKQKPEINKLGVDVMIAAGALFSARRNAGDQPAPDNAVVQIAEKDDALDLLLRQMDTALVRVHPESKEAAGKVVLAAKTLAYLARADEVTPLERAEHIVAQQAAGRGA